VKGWKVMSDEQNPCLAASEILAYLAGELPEGRKAEVDRHLDECRLCGAAVEGVAGLEWREGFLRSTDALLLRVRARTATAVTAAAAARRPVPRFRYAPQYLTLAATLFLGVGTAIVLTRPGPGEILFRRNFEPYPSTRPIVRGGFTDGGSNALALYEARDYRAALAALEDGLRREPNDAVARFYAGLCRLALGQSREATFDLEQVQRLGDEDLRVPAEWYLALAHLRGPNVAEARPHLERIAETGGFYQDKARALLSELHRLEKGN
jgi:tetratricopeptide (TPR) repeat protein